MRKFTMSLSNGDTTKQERTKIKDLKNTIEL